MSAFIEEPKVTRKYLLRLREPEEEAIQKIRRVHKINNDSTAIRFAITWAAEFIAPPQKIDND